MSVRAVQPSAFLIENILCSVHHDLCYGIILDQILKNIQASKCIKQFPADTYLLAQRQELLFRRLLDDCKDDLLKFFLPRFPCHVQTEHYFFIQQFRLYHCTVPALSVS